MPANPLGLALRSRRAGHDALVWARPGLQAPENFALTSPAFDHGTPIPERHRGRLFGANISPALAWTTPPAGTAELVLIVQDPDAPRREPATHALTLGIDPSLHGTPENVIPVSLDAGTDNQALLNDPLYLGNRHARRRGREYDAFIRRYVEALSRLFPSALLHFEGFSPENGRKILDAYGHSHRVFNGDVQGTGVLVLAAVYAASRVTGIPHEAPDGGRLRR